MGRSLRELGARFIKIVAPDQRRTIDTVEGADGVIFMCPKCYEDEPVGAIGTHSIVCWQPHVGQEHTPKPGRWQLVGTTIDDLSLVADSSSVKIEGGCEAHFHVRNGRIA